MMIELITQVSWSNGDVGRCEQEAHRWVGADETPRFEKKTLQIFCTLLGISLFRDNIAERCTCVVSNEARCKSSKAGDVDFDNFAVLHGSIQFFPHGLTDWNVLKKQ